MTKISVIIPCKNEETTIKDCIGSLFNQNVNNQIEVILVDNGSNDKTVEIVKENFKHIRIYIEPEKTISEIRNFGATLASNEWLAFIDADVIVEQDWFVSFRTFINTKRASGIDVFNIITGSTCLIPEKPTWIEKTWFRQLQVRDYLNNKYINSGHLIIHRQLFDKIGGFDVTFMTGEDEKLCNDAKKYDGIIIKENSIRAVHYGYPKSLWEFFVREKWHGIGMKKYLGRPFVYKDLQIALYNWTALFVLILFSFLFGFKIKLFLLFISLILLPHLVLSFNRSQANIIIFFSLALLYFVYGLAKMAAIPGIVYDILFERKK